MDTDHDPETAQDLQKEADKETAFSLLPEDNLR